MVAKRRALEGLAILIMLILLACVSIQIGKGQSIGTAIAGGAGFQYFDNNGAVLGGGKICTYQAGTSTPLAAFADALLTTNQSNPVILDSAGRPQPTGTGIYIGATSLKLVARQGGDGTCSTGTILWTQDHLTTGASSINGGSGASFTIQGTAQKVTVSTAGTVITISLPGLVVTNEFSATNAGSLIVFNSANFEVDGNGNVSASGQGNWITPGYITTGTWLGLNPSPSTPTSTPGGGYGAIAYKSGTQVWLYRTDTAAWVAVDLNGGGGGGGCSSPIGPATEVLTGNGSGGCTSDANLAYTGGVTPILQLLGPGYMDSAGGFRTTCVLTNCVNVPLGGILGLTLRTTDSVIWVEEAAPVVSAASQARVYADSTTHTLMWSENASSPYLPFAISSGTLTNGHCVQITVAGGITTFTDAGGACTTGGGSGTINGAPQGSVPFYSAAGTATTLSGNATFTWDNTNGILVAKGTGGLGAIKIDTTTSGQLGALALLDNGTNKWVLYKNGSNTFGLFDSTANQNVILIGSGASQNISLLPTSGLVAVFGTSSTTAGLSVTNAYIFSDYGFNANSSTCVLWNCIYAQNAGVAARSATFSKYVNLGTNASGSTTPSLTSGDSYTYGAMYYNVGLAHFYGCAAASCSVGTPGTGWVQVDGGASAGVSSLTGTSNQVLVNGGLGPVTGAVTLTLPQSIATSSSPTFANLTVTTLLTSNASGVTQGLNIGGGNMTVKGNGDTTVGNLTINGNAVVSGLYNCTGTTTSICFQTATGSFQVDGYGDGSFGGSVNAVGNVSLALAPYRVNGTAIVDSSRNLLNIGNIAMSGTLNVTTGILSSGGVQATGYNVVGGFFGQTHNVTIGGCTMFFAGGVLYSSSGC